MLQDEMTACNILIPTCKRQNVLSTFHNGHSHLDDTTLGMTESLNSGEVQSLW